MFNLFCFGKKRGQGIIEVVVAMSVITIGLISIMSLVFFNINVQNYNHNMLIVSNLAREGIEIVRNVRDSNWLDLSKDWDNFLYYGEGTGSENSFIIFNRSSWDTDDFSYNLNPAGMSWEECVSNNAFCRLYLVPILNNLEYKIYNYGYNFNGDELIEGAEASNFYRMIYINEICDTGIEEEILINFGDSCDDHSGYNKIGMQVISKVGWKNKGVIQTIEVEERIYDWK